MPLGRREFAERSETARNTARSRWGGKRREDAVLPGAKTKYVAYAIEVSANDAFTEENGITLNIQSMSSGSPRYARDDAISTKPLNFA